MKILALETSAKAVSVAITEDGRVLVTDGIADSFTPEEGSGYTYETVS